jgi:O-antigen ligase
MPALYPPTTLSILGGGALVLAAVHVLVAPPTPLLVLLAAAATIGLATHPRLGPLGAALLVLVALPFARGADTYTFDVAGIPLRPHDAITAIGLLGGAIQAARVRRPLGAIGGTVALFLGVGLIALGLGLAGPNPLRDVFRDVRWWAFYLAAILAIVSGTRRADLMRGLLLGAMAVSVVMIVAALLPVIPGGLKEQELLYDRGTLRMQFGNSVFLVPAIAWFASRFLARPSWTLALQLLLLATALVLSLTRTSILAMLGVVLLVYLAAVLGWVRTLDARARSLAGGVALVVVMVASTGLAIGVVTLGTPPPEQVKSSGGQAGEQAIDRILFQDERSDLGSLERGRFTSYRAAAELIASAPILGLGFGSLVDVPYAYSEARAHTIGKSPGVDNAYLTIGMKAGIVGVAVFGAIMVLTLVTALRRRPRFRAWFVPAWLSVLVLTMTQAFAVSLYGPFGLALLVAAPALNRSPANRR